MNAKRVSVNQKRDQKKQAQPAIEAVGADAIFDSPQNVPPSIPPKPEQKASGKDTSPEETKKVSKVEDSQSEEDKEELVKTTAYIEESKFLALEDIQLKLKRQEKRRVTKNELFNKAIELLIEHYQTWRFAVNTSNHQNGNTFYHQTILM